MGRRAGSDGMRTEAAIRAAALRLIAQQGYEAMSMRQLAQEVDLGAAALYRYFPTKQAILFDLLKGHMDELEAAWALAKLGESAPPVARLERFTRFHVRHHLPRANGVFLSYMELRSLEQQNFRVIQAQRAAYEQALTAILSDGRADGSIACEHPRMTARAVIACLTGITTWYRSDGAMSADEIEDTYWTLVARMCGASLTEKSSCSMPA